MNGMAVDPFSSHLLILTTSMEPRSLRIFTDGGSRGNPGPAASGVVVYEEIDGEMQEIERKGRYLGEATNNQAEYDAVVLALELATELTAAYVEIVMDSQLAVKQLNGDDKVKNAILAEYVLKVHNLKQNFTRVSFRHVRREQNKESDAVVNEVLDEHAEL